MKILTWAHGVFNRFWEGIGTLVSAAGAPEVGGWFVPVISWIDYILGINEGHQ